jgi:hypothetical protein
MSSVEQSRPLKRSPSGRHETAINFVTQRLTDDAVDFVATIHQSESADWHGKATAAAQAASSPKGVRPPAATRADG